MEEKQKEAPVEESAQEHAYRMDYVLNTRGYLEQYGQLPANYKPADLVKVANGPKASVAAYKEEMAEKAASGEYTWRQAIAFALIGFLLLWAWVPRAEYKAQEVRAVTDADLVP